MKNFKQDSRFGGKKFGGDRGGWKPKGRSFGGGRDSRDNMFDTICAMCGNECQVPFRPDGRKPVKCRNCFKKDGAEGRFMRDASSRKSFGRDDRFERAPRADNSQIEARLNSIEAKLDALIEALSQEE